MPKIDFFCFNPIITNYNIKHMTYDDCNYYFTTKNSKTIIKMDENLCVLKSYNTCKEYDCICYDFLEQCFFATSSQSSRYIYKLDCFMNEIDSITIYCNNKFSYVTGLSYNACNNTIVISFNSSIYELNKETEKCFCLYCCNTGYISSVLSISSITIFSFLKNNKVFLYSINANGCLENILELDSRLKIFSIVLNSCKKSGELSYLDLFIIKRKCYPYLYKLEINNNIFYECNCETPDVCCSNICNPNTDACNDILESIALVETSISQILNAEGKKLTKVLESTNDISKILHINNQTNKTLVNSMHLEHALYSKLQSIIDYCPCDELSFYNSTSCNSNS